MDGVGQNNKIPGTIYVGPEGQLIVEGYEHSARTLDSNTIEVTFERCVNVTGTAGVNISINGVYQTAISFSDISVTPPPSIITFDIAVPILPTDSLTWRYTQGNDSINYCSDGNEFTGNEIVVVNTVRLGGVFLLMETNSPILLENASGPADYDNSIEIESLAVPPGTPLTDADGNPLTLADGTPITTAT